MKKEYLILIALILLLSAYLLFNKENKDHFPLPAVAKISPDKITRLEITRKEAVITLVKDDNTWMIREKERPADTMAVENMLDALAAFKLSALVSRKKDLNRYELDSEKQIHVNVFEGHPLVFEFSMGKTAPTFNHTFVMVAGDSNVYHAKGSFRTYFEKSAEELRNKKVLSFKEKAIKTVTLEKDGKANTFTAVEEQKDDKEPVVTWQSDDGTAVDKPVLSDLLSVLALLECEKFVPEKEKALLEKKEPYCRILLNGETNFTLRLMKTSDDEALSGLSSMNPDGFVLSKFNSDDIIEKTDTLLGIKKEETPEQ